jgi:polyadenylate-binding protein 2
MKQRVEEMEREANKLRELQAAAAESNNADGGEGETGEAMETDEDKSVADSRSVFVGNVSRIDLSASIY